MVNAESSMTRRGAVQSLAALGATAMLAGCSSNPLEGQSTTITDDDIFNFALNLEYLETEYYLRGISGTGLSAADAGTNAGAVTNAPAGPVQFATSAFREYAEELAANELAHVRYYRSTLSSPVSRPALDLGAFAAAAQAAGLGAGFNPFANEINFFLGGFLMEDVGVTAYKGAAPLIQNKQFLEDAAGILAVESYHMGMVRSLLYEAGVKRELPPTPSRTREICSTVPMTVTNPLW